MGSGEERAVSYGTTLKGAPFPSSRYDAAMLRLIVFFGLAFLLASLLSAVPVIGPWIARTGCLGIWIAAMLLSWGFTKVGAKWVRIQRDRSELRTLLAVDRPHQHGKAGAMLLAQGRPGKAIEHLVIATEEEPERAEWHDRLGRALLTRAKPAEAIAALQRALEIDEEYAFGVTRMRLAEAQLAAGDAAASLATLARFERDHGPSAESAYRRGLALRTEGKREEARAAFDEVSSLAGSAVNYQRREAAKWRARASLRRWI